MVNLKPFHLIHRWVFKSAGMSVENVEKFICTWFLQLELKTDQQEHRLSAANLTWRAKQKNEWVFFRYMNKISFHGAGGWTLEKYKNCRVDENKYNI